MTRRIFKRSVVISDLLEIATYLSTERPDVADRFLDAADVAFNRLLQMPTLGAIFPTANPALEGLRIWQVPGFRSYLVFYREMSDGIEVIRVLRAARDWEWMIDGGS